MTPADPSPSPPPSPRVLQLDDGRLWRGGQHQVWLLMRELAQRGIAQRLIAREGRPLALRSREIGIDVETIPWRGEWDWFGSRRIAVLAKDFGANILHAHTGHAHAIGLGASRRLSGSAQMLSTRRVDFAVGRGFFSCQKYRRPGQYFIAISEGVRRVLIQGGVAAERIDRVYSGVPPISEAEPWTRERARREFEIGKDQIAIVNIGALTDHKGQRWLIDATPAVLAACPRSHLHIIGDGELRETLEGRIRDLSLEGRVTMHGHVESARLKLAAFDLFVSSSHLEGLGTVILDAMLAGLPVVGAAAGGIPEVVLDGKTGRLARPRDAASLAEAIIESLRQPEEAQRMAEAALIRVQSEFSVSSMAEGTLAVYRKLLAGGS